MSVKTVYYYILFLHAFTGCDTTSAFYNKGKITFPTRFEEQQHLQDAADVFKQQNQDVDTIHHVGVKCILPLYGARNSLLDLNQLRLIDLTKAIVKDVRVQLSKLPCTADAAREHVKKIYLQVQSWLGNNNLPPTEWGWRVKNFLIPNAMNQPPAVINND
jgi:hypothetical protein